MYFRFLFSVSFLLLTFYQGRAAGELNLGGGRAFAMGMASVTLTDLWSVVNNQATNAWNKKISAGFSVENRYLLKELSCEMIGLTIPLKHGSIGAVVSHKGTVKFSEIRAGISFSRKFGQHFSAGVQFDYFRMQIGGEYGSRNLCSFEIGLFYKATRNLSIGVHIENPVPVKITEYPREYLPTIIRLGLSYSFSSSFLVVLEIEKDLKNKPIIKAGTEYRFVRIACARLGIATNPTLFTFGFGLNFSRFSIDLASGYQSVLGFTPTLSLTYCFEKIKK